jgi:hypothetical protein
MDSTIEYFPEEVIKQLKTYVYRLIDPRNGETFYVGKGKGNRVFAHIRASAELEDGEVDNKIKRIHEIHLAGFEVAHVIHRHGMSDETAFEVEAALIDAYPGLTNIASGVGASAFGVMHAREIIQRYSAEPAVFQHKAILININRSAAETSLYDAVRYAWKISNSRAKQAELILPVVRGLIVGAFIADAWVDATAENFPGREYWPGRRGFIGHEAPEELLSLYLGK